MVHYFCTYFDHKYLPQGLALYRSLFRECSGARLFVLCLSNEALEHLRVLDLPGVTLIAMADFEAADAALAVAKSNRSKIEYIFTCTPTLCCYIFDHFPAVDLLTYLDADLYFFSEVGPMFTELGEASIGIIPHHFTTKRYLRFGRFNVGWISIRRDVNGLNCVRWWREQCLAWCGDRVEPERYADQKYLDQWPALFEGVHIFAHKGANVARWNITNNRLTQRDGLLWVDDQPLVFFHFAGFRQICSWLYESNFSTHLVGPSRIVRREIFGQYIAELRVITRPLLMRVSKRIHFQDIVPRNLSDITRKIIRFVRSVVFFDYVLVLDEERLIERFSDKTRFPALDRKTDTVESVSPCPLGVVPEIAPVAVSAQDPSRRTKVLLNWDGSVFSLQKGGGVSRYLTELIMGVMRLGTLDAALILYPNGHKNGIAQDLNSLLRIRRFAWLETGWPFKDWPTNTENNLEINHSPYLNLPKRRQGRINILTVHDLILHDVVMGPRSWLRIILFETALKRADHIICVSHYTKRRLLEIKPHLKGKVGLSVIPNGLSQIFREGRFKTDASDRRYLLYIGARIEYKGYYDFIAAFAAAKLNQQYRLVCVGGGVFTHADFRHLGRYGIADDVVHSGHVTDERLGVLYRGATALIYPSKEEGFGIPLLEAMSCECPIIARDIPVFREVAGQIPWYLPAVTAATLRNALDEISKGGHHHRLSLGRAKALQYTWERCSASHLELYQCLIAKGSRSER